MISKKIWALLAVCACVVWCACTKKENNENVSSSTPPIIEESSEDKSEEEEREETPIAYTLTVTATGCEAICNGGASSVLQGETVGITVSFDSVVYDADTLVVTVNGESVIGDKRTDGEYYYEWKNVSENIEVVASVQKRVYKVTFSAPEDFGFWDVVREYEHGDRIEDKDIPMYFETGWRCVWDIAERTVTKTAIYYPFVCKTVELVEEFLAIESTENYILIKNIDFAGVTFTAKENGAVIPCYEGTFFGNGYALKNITFIGADVKHLFGELRHATFQGVRLQNAIFAGSDTPEWGKRAHGCAPIGKMTMGTSLVDCDFEIVYTAVGTSQNPNAGLVYELIDGSFTNCTLFLQTPTNQPLADGVYSLYVIPHGDESDVDVTVKIV